MDSEIKISSELTLEYSHSKQAVYCTLAIDDEFSDPPVYTTLLLDAEQCDKLIAGLKEASLVLNNNIQT